MSEVSTSPRASARATRRRTTPLIVGDVRVRQKQITWRSGSALPAPRPCFCAQSLPVHPGGSGLPAKNRQAIRRTRNTRGRARRFGRAVIALIVGENDGQRHRIVLRQQAGDARADYIGFVARRHNGGNGRPHSRIGRQIRLIADIRAPKAAPRRNKVQPRGKADCA